MKNHLLLIFLAGMIFLAMPLKSQNVRVEGYVLLENSASNAGVSVVLHRTTPSEFRDTVLTGESGYYSANVLTGIYEISFNKNSYFSKSVKDVIIYENKTIDTVRLLSAGLSGRMSGLLAKGTYIVGDSIWVQYPDTLTIEAGTKLFFKKGVCMAVDGFLKAEGTEQDSIIFTRYLGDGDNPDSAYWKGIILGSNYVSSTTNEYVSKMKYCHISYCNERALNIQRCSPSIENALFSDCLGWNTVMAYSEIYFLKNLKFVNCNSGDSSLMAWGSSCLYLVNYSPGQVISNIEVTGIRNRNYSAIGLFCSSGRIMDNLYIHDNQGSIFNNYASTITINNSTIVNNYYGFGPNDASVTFNNCIIANNPGGGFWKNINNSDFFNNGQDDSQKDKWLGVNVTINRNGDSCDAYGNIQLDPQFIDPSNMDYRLNASSPCIDAGVNDSVAARHDFDGNTRIWDGNMDGAAYVDMGAFETGAPPVGKVKLVDQDFEQGLSDWTVRKDGHDPDEAWSILNDQSLAHSDLAYASLKSSGVHNSSISSTITSPVIVLPQSDNIMLTYWLSSALLNKANNKTDSPQSEKTAQVTIVLTFASDNSSQYIDNVKDIGASWTKHTMNLTAYRGKKVTIGFLGHMSGFDDKQVEIRLDDINIETESAATSVGKEITVIAIKDLITITPNPASDYISISEYNSSDVIRPISIYNMMGEKVIVIEAAPESGRIDISGLSPGVYCLVVTKDKETLRQRFVVAR